MRLIDTFRLLLGRRGSRARGRLVYRMLVDLAVPERAGAFVRKTGIR